MAGKKILMVCLGNICRSPLAHGLLRDKLKDQPDHEVDSAGTAGYHIDEAPDPRMIKTARRHGLEISNLRGRQFVQEDFDHFDEIYVMDESNLSNVLALARNDSDRKKVSMILNLSEAHQNMPVPDPYYGGDEGFEEVYRLLDRATDALKEKLSNEQ